MFASSGTGKPYGPTFTTGDVVGCCMNVYSRTAFYTKVQTYANTIIYTGIHISHAHNNFKNGVALATAFTDVKQSGMYPAVGCRTPGEIVNVNFGERKFRFDIELYCWDEKMRLKGRIAKDTNLLPLSLNDMAASMIEEYLIHEVFCLSAD